MLKKDENGVEALLYSILMGTDRKESFKRVNGKVTDTYDPKLSIRANAKRMGVSPSTVQRIKKKWKDNPKQISLFEQ